MNYKEAMDYIESIQRFGSVLGLENIRELMRRLLNPQDGLEFVHVAGTNGKGSVCTFVSAILREAGYRVGRYISPTIFHYRERIQVDGQWILEDAFAGHIEKIKRVADLMVLEGKPHPTPFEVETAAAFLEFAQKKCDIVVLETGLGGRLDSTNIIKTPKCGIFTSISMDHMGILGDSIEKIAMEKAGIIKENMDVISYPQQEAAEAVIRKACDKMGGSFYPVDLKNIKNPVYSLEKTVFEYLPSNAFQGGLSLTEPIPLESRMLGENQVNNIATAIEGVLCLSGKGYAITREHIQKGIKKAKWPGRFSAVSAHPLVIADGAHNEEAALSLKRSEELYFSGRSIIRVIGIFKDKEYEKIIKDTVNPQDWVITVTPPHERGLKSSKLAQCAAKYCHKVTDGKTPKNGLSLALLKAAPQDVVLVYGSLSFLHEIYEYFQEDNEEWKSVSLMF